MMIDSVTLLVKGGNGGNGCVSFRREKFVPRGGPDGGDGGHGGGVFLIGDGSINTLKHLSYKNVWKAKRGLNGRGQHRRGANGDDLVIKAPLGTIVWKFSSGEKEIIADICEGDRILVARGGVGGAGNSRFVSSTNQEPVLAENGGRGEEVELNLELKLLADVGIIGRPNAGKSTLLAQCSAAKPKIAAYPFTTLEPALGVVRHRRGEFVMMEVPGLVDGAHVGVGLGYQFLRHAERARLLVHLLDGQMDDPIEEMERVNEELRSFAPALALKPQIIVMNKKDIAEVREKEPGLAARLETFGVPLLSISAATGEGVEDIIAKAILMLESLPKEGVAPYKKRERKSPTVTKNNFAISRENGVYVVYSSRIERLIPNANMQDWRARIQIWKELDRQGIVNALEGRGIQQGDTVRLGTLELQWF